METLLMIVGLLIGLALGYLLATSRHKADTAAWQAERLELEHAARELELSKRELEQAQQRDDRTAEEERLALALAPLNSALTRLEQHAKFTEMETSKKWGSVREQLQQMQQFTNDLHATTTTLASAMTSSGTRGTWGEVQLQRLVEVAGLQNHVDFSTQVSGTNDDGKSVRPDAVVHLPGERNVIIDSKAPMDSYLRANEPDLSGPDRDSAYAAHAKAVRSHITQLASKKYWSAVDDTPEYVICFLPSDAVFAAAAQRDGELLDFAYSRQIILATPATLLAVLKSVALTWQHDSLNDNMQAVVEAGRELHKRFATMSGHLDNVGKDLRKTVDDYNKLIGSAESRVFPSARKLGELGISDTEIHLPSPVANQARALTSPDWESHGDVLPHYEARGTKPPAQSPR